MKLVIWTNIIQGAVWLTAFHWGRVLRDKARAKRIQHALSERAGRMAGYMLKERLRLEPNYRRDWITIFCIA